MPASKKLHMNGLMRCNNLDAGQSMKWEWQIIFARSRQYDLELSESPGSVSTSMVPPCCFTMMSWLMEAKPGAFAGGKRQLPK
jgi:hypothetical protein